MDLEGAEVWVAGGGRARVVRPPFLSHAPVAAGGGAPAAPAPDAPDAAAAAARRARPPLPPPGRPHCL